MQKIAVILFNLGGPDSPKAVKPFLFNLFNDAAIIRLPQPFRTLLATFISSRRAKTASKIYAELGGASPILKNTEAQAVALQNKLGNNFKCFIAMRYWHPFAHETAKAVKAFAPDQIILLPLYPQFSTSTTASSFKNWEDAAKKENLSAPTKTICCYPNSEGFISALTNTTRALHEKAKAHGTPRILFSAHGLPEKFVTDGDPYQWQCEETAKLIRNALNIPNLDSAICYQSRVGRLKWIGPSTEDEIIRAAATKTPIVIVPTSFVSEHSETLVELGIEYRALAAKHDAPFYEYAAPVGTNPDFIASLAALVEKTLQNKETCISSGGPRLCPAHFSGCCFASK